MFGHTGSLRGFYGAMWYYPDSQLTVVVLDNQGRIDPNPIADAWQRSRDRCNLPRAAVRTIRSALFVP